jgi:hypothetical protein
MEQPPPLTDVYVFGEWLKRFYTGSMREPMTITPVVGGLIRVTVLKPEKPEEDHG